MVKVIVFNLANSKCWKMRSVCEEVKFTGFASPALLPQLSVCAELFGHWLSIFLPLHSTHFFHSLLAQKLFITQGNLVKSFRRRSSKVTHIHGHEVAKIFPYKQQQMRIIQHCKEFKINNFEITLANISRVRTFQPCFFRHVHNVNNSVFITQGRKTSWFRLETARENRQGFHLV